MALVLLSHELQTARDIYIKQKKVLLEQPLKLTTENIYQHENMQPQFRGPDRVNFEERHGIENHRP